MSRTQVTAGGSSNPESWIGGWTTGGKRWWPLSASQKAAWRYIRRSTDIKLVTWNPGTLDQLQHHHSYHWQQSIPSLQVSNVSLLAIRDAHVQAPDRMSLQC